MLQLQAAFDRFHAPQEGDPDANSEIERNQVVGIVDALRAIVDYVRTPGDIPAEFLDPIYHLLAAIADLDQGIGSPLLKRRKIRSKGGRPGNSHYRGVTFATAAAAATRLIREGSSEKEAVRRVAGAIRVSEKELRNFRDDLMRDRKATFIRESYNMVLKKGFTKGQSTDVLVEALRTISLKQIG